MDCFAEPVIRRRYAPTGWLAMTARDRDYFGLESGGQFGSTFSGLPPLCTVGAAELDPPASGSTALFPTAMELAVFSSPLPVVAAGDVVHAVSGLTPDAAVDCAAAGLTLNIPARIAAATRVIFVSNDRQAPCQQENVLLQRWFRKVRHCDLRAARRMLGILGSGGAGFAYL